MWWHRFLFCYSTRLTVISSPRTVNHLVILAHALKVPVKSIMESHAKRQINANERGTMSVLYATLLYSRCVTQVLAWRIHQLLTGCLAYAECSLSSLARRIRQTIIAIRSGTNRMPDTKSAFCQGLIKASWYSTQTEPCRGVDYIWNLW